MIENLGKRCLRVSGSANQVGVQGWINLLWGTSFAVIRWGERREGLGFVIHAFPVLGVGAGSRCSVVLVVGLMSLSQRAW
jgi:hypothetical protein